MGNFHSGRDAGKLIGILVLCSLPFCAGYGARQNSTRPAVMSAAPRNTEQSGSSAPSASDKTQLQSAVQTTTTDVCPRPDAGSAVPEPEDLRSHDSVLKVELTVRNT